LDESNRALILISFAFLYAQCGIKGKLQHAEYLNNWVKVLKQDDKAIFRAASKAREASEFINELVLEKKQEHSNGQEMEV